jgi:RNA processing factor Prp31
MSKYRNQITNDTVIAEQSDIDNETDFMLVSDVESIIDDIEKRVNEIYEKLEPIQGLSKIDEIKRLIKDLSSDLY